jgi:hypothetical protein
VVTQENLFWEGTGAGRGRGRAAPCNDLVAESAVGRAEHAGETEIGEFERPIGRNQKIVRFEILPTYVSGGSVKKYRIQLIYGIFVFINKYKEIISGNNKLRNK